MQVLQSHSEVLVITLICRMSGRGANKQGGGRIYCTGFNNEGWWVVLRQLPQIWNIDQL